ncbi:unnamed protein product, partial [marine sediment metagenome]
ILTWAGITPPSDLAGRPLPTVESQEIAQRDLLSAYTDTPLRIPERVRIAEAPEDDAEESLARRTGCGPEDRVFGDTVSLIRYPHKLIWFEDNPPQLFDLSWDPRGLSDQAVHQPELSARLAREVEARIKGSKLATPDPADVPEIKPEVYEQMKALGYTD